MKNVESIPEHANDCLLMPDHIVPRKALRAEGYANARIAGSRASLTRRLRRTTAAGSFAALILSCVVWAPAYAAEIPAELKWKDLVVELPPSENPFATLSVEQLDQLTDVGAFRDRRSRGETLLPQEVTIERDEVNQLQKAGIAIDTLLAKRTEVSEKLKANESVTNPSLDKKLVRMSGFLLPLDHAGKKVTEFLLVPWVGACIHTPPPPPNQIVYVKLDKPYETKRQFEPVWVTGRLATTGVTKSVFITDGSADFDAGYSMRASRLEPYH